MRPVRVLAAMSALSLIACLPNPQSVKERREGFDRAGLEGELILSSAPSDMVKVGANFGDQVKLEGYKLDPARPTPGDRVHVTYYWSALRPVDEDYKVFVHGDAIGGQAGRIHGDHFPARGKYPSDVWQKGEIIVDEFVMWVPPGYGPKRLGFYTGLYKGNYRVPLKDGGARPKERDNRSLAVEINF